MIAHRRIEDSAVGCQLICSRDWCPIRQLEVDHARCQGYEIASHGRPAHVIFCIDFSKRHHRRSTKFRESAWCLTGARAAIGRH